MEYRIIDDQLFVEGSTIFALLSNIQQYQYAERMRYGELLAEDSELLEISKGSQYEDVFNQKLDDHLAYSDSVKEALANIEQISDGFISIFSYDEGSGTYYLKLDKDED